MKTNLGIIELLEEKGFGLKWKYPNDPELFDTLAYFREEAANDFDGKKEAWIISQYVSFLRKIFRYYPDFLDLSEEYTRLSNR